jgi:hypothetical protein
MDFTRRDDDETVLKNTFALGDFIGELCLCMYRFSASATLDTRHGCFTYSRKKDKYTSFVVALGSASTSDSTEEGACGEEKVVASTAVEEEELLPSSRYLRI